MYVIQYPKRNVLSKIYSFNVNDALCCYIIILSRFTKAQQN